MHHISEDYIELSRVCHGYKESFYYLDKASVFQLDSRHIKGEIVFKIPDYLRISKKDKIFNNTEMLLASNQINYLIYHMILL